MKKDNINISLLYENSGVYPKTVKEVVKAKMFWAARLEDGKNMPPIGFEVPTWSLNTAPREFIELENRLEEIRKRVNPQAPSRLTCKFICPDLSGWCECNSRKNICEVEVTGNIFIADYEEYSNVSDSWRGYRSRSDFSEYAERYWEPTGNAYFPEVLVDGKVVVVGYACGDD